MKDILIVTGPTGSGKSELAIQMAKELNGEILSADSVQIYKYFDIGSGKISKAEQKIVPHHLIDILEPTEAYSVKDFQNQAYSIIDGILYSGKVPIICGGTMLYIHSILYNLKFEEESKDMKVREDLEKQLAREGLESLLKELKMFDEETYNHIDRKNPRRVIRALEKIQSGQSIENQFRILNPNFSFHYYVLNWKREILYNRINLRVNHMVEQGLFDEAKSLYEQYGLVKPMTTIGYKEIVDFIDGIYTYEETIDKIKQHSRNYAKRQLTWFRREGESIPIDMEAGDPLQQIMDNLYERQEK